MKIDVLALLRRELRLRELVAQDASLKLEERADGSSNWAFDPVRGAGTEDAPDSAPKEDPSEGLAFVGFDRLSLERLELLVVRPGTDSSSLWLASLEGSGSPDDPVRIEGSGQIGPEAFSLEITTDSIRSGADRSKPWAAAVELAIANSRATLDGRFGFEAGGSETSGARAVVLPNGRRAPDLRLHFEGARLDDLDGLARVELPPLGPFEVEGRIRFTAEGFEVSDAAVRLGGSTLSGRGHYARGAPPTIEARLESPLIQLDDFRTEPWSPFASDPNTAEAERADDPNGASEPARDTDASGEPAALVSSENLRRGEGRLEVVVEEVRSGTDFLGRGELLATLHDARFELAVDLAVPGGPFGMTFRAEPSGDSLDMGLVLRSDRFDYGLLARRIDPEATAAGWLSLDVDIHALARRPTELLASADGTLAFAVFPENLNAEVFDLWAANLLLAVIPKLGEDSKLNCAAARMRIAGGHLKQEELLLDTSTMRVGGRVGVDFEARTIEALFAPVAKEPHMFSAETPVQVRGTFEDFGLGVRPQDVVVTVVRMATSPLLVPLKRIVRRSMDRDGRELCDAVVNSRTAQSR